MLKYILVIAILVIAIQAKRREVPPPPVPVRDLPHWEKHEVKKEERHLEREGVPHWEAKRIAADRVEKRVERHEERREGRREERGGRKEKKREERHEERRGGRGKEEKGPAPANCDCYGWSVYKCGPHSVTAQACRNQVVTECSIRCPAEDFSDCTSWSVARCTNIPTFIGTWCRQIVAGQCTARAQGLRPDYVPERCDCYGQSLYKCGPHSVANLDCRQKEAERCVQECKPTQADCANCNAFANARCSDIVTYVGGTCRGVVLPACQKECAAPQQPQQPVQPVQGTQDNNNTPTGGNGPAPANCDCYGWSVYKCGPHSVTAQACRTQVVTECSIRCPAEDFSNCNGWSVARCTNIPTFIGTWCRQIVAGQCTARAQGLTPNYVPERCDCYGQSLYKCGPHSVANLDCRQKEAERCVQECKPTQADCADCNAFANARCSDIVTYVGGTCRNTVLPACQKECAAPQPPQQPVQPAPVYQPAPTPVYQPAPQQPAPAPVYQPAPAPVYQPAPTPVYQPVAPVDQPAPVQPAPAPVYQPAPQQPNTPVYPPAPQQPAPAPVYQPAPTPVYQPVAPVDQPTPVQPAPAPVYQLAPQQPAPVYPPAVDQGTPVYQPAPQQPVAQQTNTDTNTITTTVTTVDQTVEDNDEEETNKYGGHHHGRHHHGRHHHGRHHHGRHHHGRHHHEGRDHEERHHEEHHERHHEEYEEGDHNEWHHERHHEGRHHEGRHHERHHGRHHEEYEEGEHNEWHHERHHERDHEGRDHEEHHERHHEEYEEGDHNEWHHERHHEGRHHERHEGRHHEEYEEGEHNEWDHERHHERHHEGRHHERYHERRDTEVDTQRPKNCDCYKWSVYKCGPHSVTAQACRTQVVTECSIRCPAEDFSDCTSWSVARCTDVATFIGTWCRQIVAGQCTARAQGLTPNYVPERCDCYGQSLYKCGPHSVANLDCRQKEAERCVQECKPTHTDCADCNAFANARCSDIVTYVGGTCRNTVLPACQKECSNKVSNIVGGDDNNPFPGRQSHKHHGNHYLAIPDQQQVDQQ